MCLRTPTIDQCCQQCPIKGKPGGPVRSRVEGHAKGRRPDSLNLWKIKNVSKKSSYLQQQTYNEQIYYLRIQRWSSLQKCSGVCMRKHGYRSVPSKCVRCVASITRSMSSIPKSIKDCTAYHNEYDKYIVMQHRICKIKIKLERDKTQIIIHK